MEKFHVKITSAVVLSGQIVTPGTIAYVDKPTAQNLLQRGRAEVATEHDEVHGDGTGAMAPGTDEVATKKTKAKAK